MIGSNLIMQSYYQGYNQVVSDMIDNYRHIWNFYIHNNCLCQISQCTFINTYWHGIKICIVLLSPLLSLISLTNLTRHRSSAPSLSYLSSLRLPPSLHWIGIEYSSLWTNCKEVVNLTVAVLAIERVGENESSVINKRACNNKSRSKQWWQRSTRHIMLLGGHKLTIILTRNGKT